MNKEFFARKKDIDELQINKANASDVYTKEEVINKITEKITEIVADAPEDFDTLKEMSDWINKHEGSAAAMNTAINTNKTDIADIQTTLSSKVDKEEGKSLVSDSEIARLAKVENYDDTQIKNDIAINRTTLGTQCKNLHDTLSVNWYQPDKISVSSNGTVTATITSDTRNFTYANSEHYITLEAGNYIITVNTLEFVSGSAALIRGCNSDNQSLFALSVSSAGLHKAAFSLSEKTTIGIMYKLYSQTCTIMIRDADILGDTYEPYKESVDERLIQNKSDIAVNKTTLGYQCKNLLKIVPNTTTLRGVTCVIDDNGIVTVNGTATEVVFFGIGFNISLDETLEYTLTGTYNNSQYGQIYYQFGNTTDGTKRYNDYGNGVTFKGVYGEVSLRIPAGAVLNNVKYYPMLRYADITDDTYEPYQPSLQEQINQLSDTSNSGKLLYNMSEVVSSPLTVNITGLFTAYTVVVCNVLTSNGKHSLTLPLKYIKSLGTSAFYEAENILFYYVDDNKIKIATGLGQSNPTINDVKIISLF